MSLKNPLINYLLLWLTFGIYGIVWAFRAMHSLNEITQRQIYNLKLIGIGMIAFVMWDLFLISRWQYSPNQFLFFVLLFQHLAWIIFIFFGIYHLALQIKHIESGLGLNDPLSPGKSVLFMAVYFAAVPYLQKRLNRIEDSDSRKK